MILIKKHHVDKGLIKNNYIYTYTYMKYTYHDEKDNYISTNIKINITGIPSLLFITTTTTISTTLLL